MIDIMLITVSLIILIIASYSDVKTREVPDWVSYSGIFAGLGLRLLYSITTFNWNIILEGAIGFGVMLAIAYLMFYLRQWGGGDAKILMAIGALIGLRFDVHHMNISFFVNLIIIGAIYGLGWNIYLILRNWKNVMKRFKEIKKKPSSAVSTCIITIAVLVLIITAFFLEPTMRYLLIALALVAWASLYLVFLVKSVEDVVMLKKIPVGKLTEGDWIAKNVYFKKKKICGPSDNGISLKQINKLKKSKIRKVLVKEGIPFVPSFLIAFVITLILGNIVVFFM